MYVMAGDPPANPPELAFLVGTRDLGPAYTCLYLYYGDLSFAVRWGALVSTCCDLLVPLFW
jgi:hypothetical protein